MPELPEVETYRLLGERAIGRRISEVLAPDAWYLKRGLDAQRVGDALRGRRFTGARRVGKLMLLDTDAGVVVGLRFGMTGRLVVDNDAGDTELIYSSNADNEAWDRFTVRFDDGGDLRMRDPRRLGGVELDPPIDRLGDDALTITRARLAAALAGSAAPVKARLLDQSRVAGVGNLIADETLFRAGIDPRRPSRSLDPDEIKRLHTALRRSVRDLMKRGGSHTGDFLPHRVPGGTCPKDGTPLLRATVGTRTTWWCPTHQI
ncbi:MAG TPA: DNA-formamidopyrimidine glycosylase family protein [Acidimicrobiales bacterium]|nr:DNA-formamidopyrimidine glycosylase family protein [Acidimicrobiales bacterium]